MTPDRNEIQRRFAEERAAVEYLTALGISTAEDFRSPVKLAQLHQQTGSTALQTEANTNENRSLVTPVRNIVDL